MTQPTVEHYVDVVRSVWPQIEHYPTHLVRMDDFDVLVADRTALFRFPCTEDGVRDLSRRSHLLDQLAPLADELGVAVPAVIVRHDRDQRLGHAFVGIRLVPGEQLRRESVAALGPLAFRFAERLAGFLTRLNSVNVSDSLRVVLHPGPDWVETASACRERVLPVLPDLVRQRAEAALDAMTALPRTDNPRLVHGSLDANAMLWDSDAGAITAVLNWGDAHLGDPALDLATVGASLGWELAATVAELWQGRGEPVLGRARTYAEALPLWRALQVVRAGDDHGRRLVLTAWQS